MRRRWAGWSLRTRLVALTVVLLTLVLTAIPLITGLVVEASLHAELDDRVNKLAVVLRAEDERRQRHRGTDPTRCPAGGSGRDGLGFIRSAGTLFGTVGVETRDGEVIDGAVLDRAREGLRPLTGEQSAAVADMPPDRGPRTRTVPGLGDYRLIAHRAHGGEVMITGLPMGEVENTVSRFLTVHAGVSVGGIVLVGLAAAAAVSLTLRPLRRIAQTATRVSEQTLHKGEVAELERVPEGDTRPGTEAGQVGAALNRLLDHVGAALSARHASETRVRQFVADASHELRTPLASIRGYAELTRRSGERPPPRTAHALRRVESEADRMTSLVEDLLLLARLDSGRPLAPAPVELSALVIDAVSDARAVGPEHRWRLELPDEPVRVEADPDRLLQILVNLLANARAHTPAGTTVTVSVHEERGGHPAHGPGGEPVGRGERAGGDAVVITVRDDGPGIPPELLPQVFERFAKGESSRSRVAGSSGLGLAIVRALVLAHDGTVDVSSAPGRTAFVVRLPYETTDTTGTADTAEPAEPAGTAGGTGSAGGEAPEPGAEQGPPGTRATAVAPARAGTGTA